GGASSFTRPPEMTQMRNNALPALTGTGPPQGLSLEQRDAGRYLLTSDVGNLSVTAASREKRQRASANQCGQQQSPRAYKRFPRAHLARGGEARRPVRWRRRLAGCRTDRSRLHPGIGWLEAAGRSRAMVRRTAGRQPG